MFEEASATVEEAVAYLKANGREKGPGRIRQGSSLRKESDLIICCGANAVPPPLFGGNPVPGFSLITRHYPLFTINQDGLLACILPSDGSSKQLRKNWARLIQNSYELDPLVCS